MHCYYALCTPDTILVLYLDLPKLELHRRIAAQEIHGQFERSFLFIHFDDLAFAVFE